MASTKDGHKVTRSSRVFSFLAEKSIESSPYLDRESFQMSEKGSIGHEHDKWPRCLVISFILVISVKYCTLQGQD